MRCIPMQCVTAIHKRTLLGFETRIELTHTSERARRATPTSAAAQSTWLVSLSERDAIYDELVRVWRAASHASCYVVEDQQTSKNKM